MLYATTRKREKLSEEIVNELPSLLTVFTQEHFKIIKVFTL
jgi:hypothetical protein